MDVLTLFGLLAVTAMLVCYALEKRSHWFTLAFAVGCVLAIVAMPLSRRSAFGRTPISSQ